MQYVANYSRPVLIYSAKQGTLMHAAQVGLWLALNLSKAFDRVSRSGLLSSLQQQSSTLAFAKKESGDVAVSSCSGLPGQVVGCK